MDTVGEFPQAADQPESGLEGDSGVRESRFPDGPDEFTNAIHCYFYSSTSYKRH
jgi:hypothetical protein